MATKPSEATPGRSLSLSDAEVLLMSIEARLWSLDRTSDAAPIIEELEQVLTEIREALKSVLR